MHITLADKHLEIQLKPAAKRALAERSTPLLAEMELLFSCLLRKKVRFRDDLGEDALWRSGNLAVSFRPIVTSHCSVSSLDGPPPVRDFHFDQPERFLPRWLRIDYQRGQWIGEFGY